MVTYNCEYCGYKSVDYCTTIDFWNASEEMKALTLKEVGPRLCCSCGKTVRADYSDEPDET